MLSGKQWAIVQGDAREVLAGMDDQSVHCVVTSPPYFGLRSYGTPPIIWGGASDCEHSWKPWGSQFDSLKKRQPLASEAEAISVKSRPKASGTRNANSNSKASMSGVDSRFVSQSVEGGTKTIGERSTGSRESESTSLVNPPIAVEIAPNEVINHSVRDIRPGHTPSLSGTQAIISEQIDQVNSPDEPSPDSSTVLCNLSSHRSAGSQGRPNELCEVLVSTDKADLPIGSNISVRKHQAEHIGEVVRPSVKQLKTDRISVLSRTASPKAMTPERTETMSISCNPMPPGTLDDNPTVFAGHRDSGVSASRRAMSSLPDPRRTDNEGLSTSLTDEGDAHNATSNMTMICQKCGAVKSSLGLEPTPELYIEHLVGIFREVKRVLRDDGTVWLNIAGCYAGSWGNYHPTGTGGQRPKSTERYERRAYASRDFLPPTANVSSFKPKDWIPIPWLLGLALQADGWWLRSPIIWAKGLSFCEEYSGSVMPESVTDRPTTSYEYVLLLTKAKNYYYDADAVRERQTEQWLERTKRIVQRPEPRLGGTNGKAEHCSKIYASDPVGRNLRSVWAINPHPFGEAHFATFPPALVEPCIKAGTSQAGCCPECGKPWERIIEKTGHINKREPAHQPGNDPTKTDSTGWAPTSRATENWRPGCECYAKEWMRDERAEISTEPCIVLDPFCGSGTTVMVALRLGRRAIGIELSGAYVKMSRRRIIGDNPMFNGPGEATA